MTTVSYPAVGNGGLNDAQWSILYGGEDGIYNDFTSNGNAFELQLISASNIARILAPTVPTGATAPVIKVNGYGLQVTANEDFTVPNPVTTTTYSLYAQYDPALNVADGSGNANPLGPVRLLFSAGDPDNSGGKQSFVLYTIRRQPGQALSAITPLDYRQWFGPHRSGNSLLYEQAEGAASPYPRGALFTDSGGVTYAREPVSGVMRWVPIAYDEGTAALTLASGMSAQDTAPRYTPPKRDNVVRMQGTIKRTAGGALVSASSTSDVNIAFIPAEYAPSSIRRFPVYGSGQRLAFVKVTNDGYISVYAGGVALDWVDLSSISYRIGA
jgi:hypothetical protein